MSHTPGASISAGGAGVPLALGEHSRQWARPVQLQDVRTCERPRQLARPVGSAQPAASDPASWADTRHADSAATFWRHLNSLSHNLPSRRGRVSNARKLKCGQSQIAVSLGVGVRLGDPFIC